MTWATTAIVGGGVGGYLLGKSSGGGGSGGSPSSTSVTTSNIAPWAQPGVQSLIQSGLYNVYPNYDPTTGSLGNQSGYTPFNANATDPMTQQALNAAQSTTAGFTPLQQQSYNTAANMQMPGQYDSATGLNNQAGYGALGTTGQANMYGQMGAMAGNSYGMNAQNPNAVANYMNPYLQNTLAPSLQILNQQYGMQNVANNAQATQAGAFGGSRMGVQNALTNQAQNLATNQLVGNAYNQAYNTANTNMQNAANLGIQGAQAGLAGVNAQQAGYNAAGNAGNNLANIGTQQLNAQQGIAGLQNAYGSQQQQQQQNILNQGMANYSTMQQYPMQQLAQLESLYTGAPQNVTTQNYTAAPSMISQVAGLGLAGYGLNNALKSSGTPATKKEGGRIKAPDNRGGIDKLKTPGFEKFAEGGIVGFSDGGEVKKFSGQDGNSFVRSTDGGKTWFLDVPSGSNRIPIPPALQALAGKTFTSRDEALDAWNKSTAPQPITPPQVAPSTTGIANPFTNTATPGAQPNPLYSLTSQNTPAPGPTPMMAGQNTTPSGAPSTTTQAPSSTEMPQPGLAGIKLPTAPSISATPYLDQLYQPDTMIKKLNNHVGDLNTLAEKLKPTREYKSFDEFNEASKAALGESPTVAQNARLDKQELKDNEEKKDAVNYALIDAGLGMLAGSSPYWNVNVGEGLKRGMSDYKETMKGLKAASLERDKMRDAAANADYAFKRGNWSDYNKSVEDYKNREATMNAHQISSVASLYGADEGAVGSLLHGSMTAQAGILSQSLSGNAALQAQGLAGQYHLLGAKIGAAPHYAMIDAMEKYKGDPNMVQYDKLQQAALVMLQKDDSYMNEVDPVKQQAKLQQTMQMIAKTNPYFSSIAGDIGFSKKPTGAGNVYSLMPTP